MDYHRHYDRLINRARHRTLTGYSERHHVIPKCIGGLDTEANIVTLTPEEHYVAHQLLVKMHPGNRRFLWAASAMAGKTAKQSGRNNKLYGWIKRRLADDASRRWKGREFSEETRAKMSASHMGVKRGPHSAEHKAKIAAAHKGRKRGPQSVERRRHASEGMTDGMLKVWQERKLGLRPMPHKNPKGFYFEKSRNLWRARIPVDGEVMDLGFHQTAELAKAAVDKYRSTIKT